MMGASMAGAGAGSSSRPNGVVGGGPAALFGSLDELVQNGRIRPTRRPEQSERGNAARSAEWTSRGAALLATAITVLLGAAGGATGQEPAAGGAAGEAAGPPATAAVIRLIPDPVASTASTGDLTVGDRFWVTVQGEGPPGYRLIPQSLLDALAARPELAVTGTERRDGALRLEIALFRPGDVVLPPVQARVLTERGDTVPAAVVADTIRIASVLAPGDTLLADIKPPWRPAGIPAWVWWAVLAAAAALALLLVWWWRRRRRHAPPVVQPVRAPRDAYLAARERIVTLSREPAGPGEGAAAAAGIGEALRDYLADGWRVPARESTTLELLAALPPGLARRRPVLGSVLATADLAKYARVAPAAGEIPVVGSRAIQLLDDLEGARGGAVAAA